MPPHRFKAASACVLLLAAALLGGSAQADSTLYDQLGGSTGLTQIVDRFVVIVSADGRTKADFDNISFDWLKPRLRDFICELANGPCHYKGRSIAAAHEGLDLTQVKFNAVAEDLQAAMEQTGVPYRTQNRLLARLAPLQRDIVRR